jgi:hypothetical protein
MRNIAKLVLAVACSAFFAGQADAQSMGYSFGGRPGRTDPQVNVYLSQRYDHLLQVSPGFRAYRIRRECSPINWPGLRADCIASFDQYEPMLVANRAGYWSGPRHWWHHRHGWHHARWYGHRHWRHHRHW